LRVTPRSASQSQSIEARIDVANGGPREAEETVFLFTHDVLASVVRPLLELRAFGKIKLAPGARGTVTLSFAASELRFLGLNLQPVFEYGDFEILVGPYADRSQLLSAVVRLVP
jgi:beta-glucosidase